MSEQIHTPVLLDEVLEYLDVQPGKVIIDCTLAEGGHAFSIAEKIAPNGKLIGLEWDPVLFQEIVKKISVSSFAGQIIAINDSYLNLKKICKSQNIEPEGILFDLGLSSWHYEQSGRGFSFLRDEILDMRFNPTQGQTAAELINSFSEVELSRILAEYGEEKFSESIAKAISQARKKKRIITTFDLVKVIESAVPNWYKHRKINFATKTFQALRIAVNNELENVRQGVQASLDVVKPGGRVVVISFQGLEDKIVKDIFKQKVKEKIVSFVSKGTIQPSWSEQLANRRARSAKMKVVQKL